MASYLPALLNYNIANDGGVADLTGGLANGDRVNI